MAFQAIMHRRPPGKIRLKGRRHCQLQCIALDGQCQPGLQLLQFCGNFLQPLPGRGISPNPRIAKREEAACSMHQAQIGEAPHRQERRAPGPAALGRPLIPAESLNPGPEALPWHLLGCLIKAGGQPGHGHVGPRLITLHCIKSCRPDSAKSSGFAAKIPTGKKPGNRRGLDWRLAGFGRRGASVREGAPKAKTPYTGLPPRSALRRECFRN